MALFVTGGSGFLGSRIVQSLIAGGDPVFALSRSGAADAALAALGAAPVRGDLDGSPLALPQIRAVVHAAAHSPSCRAACAVLPNQRRGHARASFATARAAGAERFVFISAAGVVMDDHGSVVRQVDETAPVFPDSFSPYIASKAQAERIVLAATTRRGFRTLGAAPAWHLGGRGRRVLEDVANFAQKAAGVRLHRWRPLSFCDLSRRQCRRGRRPGAPVRGALRGYFVNDRKSQRLSAPSRSMWQKGPGAGREPPRPHSPTAWRALRAR